MGYFDAKSREVMAGKGGDPANAGPLARWAAQHAADGDPLSGVIIGRDGTILAETVRIGHGMTADHVTTADAARWGLTGTERGMATARISAEAGQDAVWVPRWEVTRGAGKFIREPDMTPAELRGIREVCGYSLVECADMLGTSRASMQRMERGTQPVRAGFAQVMRGLLDAYHADVDAETARTTETVTVPAGWRDGRPARWWRQVAVEAAVRRAARVVSE